MLYKYSLQLAIKYKKYYKSLFLGLVDLAVINAYIVYNARRAADGMKKLSHVKFLKKLHLQLCQLRDEDWHALLNNTDSTPSKKSTKSSSTGHNRVQNDKWRAGNNQTGRKRRTRVCKVCSLLKGSDDVRGVTLRYIVVIASSLQRQSDPKPGECSCATKPDVSTMVCR